MNCKTVPWRDESAVAVHAAISAARRKSLEMPLHGAYSAAIDTHTEARKDHTMNATYTTSFLTRATAFVVAALTSAVVLGSTVAGMQPHDDAGLQTIALERVTITATRTN